MKRVITTEYSEHDFIELLSNLLQPIIEKALQNVSIPQNKSPPTTELYYTRQDLCLILKMSLPTIGKLTEQGILKSYKFGKAHRYKCSEIEKFINSKHKK